MTSSNSIARPTPGLAELRDMLRAALVAGGGDLVAAVPPLLRALDRAARRGGDKAHLLRALDSVLSGPKFSTDAEVVQPWLARQPAARYAQAERVLAALAPDIVVGRR